MGKFKEKLYRFMYGRYGTDALYNFLSVLVLILLIAEWILSIYTGNSTAGAIILLILTTFNLFILIWLMFRCMSRNIEKRRRENTVYLNIRNAIKRFFTRNTSSKSKRGPKDNATYIFRDCTKCSNTLRLPYKAGRNAVVCPKCSHRFFVRAKKLK